MTEQPPPSSDDAPALLDEAPAAEAPQPEAAAPPGSGQHLLISASAVNLSMGVHIALNIGIGDPVTRIPVVNSTTLVPEESAEQLAEMVGNVIRGELAKVRRARLGAPAPSGLVLPGQPGFAPPSGNGRGPS